MKTIVHRADTRGYADHGWLKTRQTFSFSSYFDPERMGFGKFRVLNDDIIEASAGFDTHPHRNMEIISIPIEGALRHKDNTGSSGVITLGEVQVMSAGTGIFHSEYNASDTQKANFLQLWILPKELNIEPRYEQKRFGEEGQNNTLQTVASSDASNGALWLNQDAAVSLGNFNAGATVPYAPTHPGNGAYVFVIEGAVEAGGEVLGKRDAVGISDTDAFDIRVLQDGTRILVVDVPME